MGYWPILFRDIGIFWILILGYAIFIHYLWDMGYWVKNPWTSKMLGFWVWQSPKTPFLTNVFLCYLVIPHTLFWYLWRKHALPESITKLYLEKKHTGCLGYVCCLETFLPRSARWVFTVTLLSVSVSIQLKETFCFKILISRKVVWPILYIIISRYIISLSGGLKYAFNWILISP